MVAIAGAMVTVSACVGEYRGVKEALVKLIDIILNEENGDI